MGRIVLFWLGLPPDPTIPYRQWLGFKDMIAGWILGAVILISVVILMFYWRSARRLKISNDRPLELFQPYRPLLWLWLSGIPIMLIGILFCYYYTDYFGASVIVIGYGIVAGLWAGLLTFMLSYTLLTLPVLGITPAKFKYRPLWLVYRHRGRRVLSSSN